MQVNCSKLPWLLDERLIEVLNNVLLSAPENVDDGVIISFRDEKYSASEGGFHPVEIALRRDGTLLYITDFNFVGDELCKCLDFDFSLQVFQYYGMDSPIMTGREVFQLFQDNFISYHKKKVYTVSLEPW